MPLKCSSAFLSCAVPLNLDTYRECQHNCRYCFMRNRVIGKRNKELTTPNLTWLRNKFHKIYDKNEYNPENLIETMLHQKLDIHCGTKSDPFQPQEKTYEYTREAVTLCNEYDQHLIFTTKSNTYHNVPCNPENHAFQLSITNHKEDKYLEPDVPPFKSRVQFYNRLKDEGYRVGIRFEPFLPNVTNVQEILSYFDEPDCVHISKLNLSPQINNDELIHYLGLNKDDLICRGTYYLKPEILYNKYLEPVFNFLEEQGYNYSARNAYIGNQKCCCGDKLIRKTNTFDPYHMYHTYGEKWKLEQALTEMGTLRNCDCRFVFTSNRWYDNKTCEDFYSSRWNRKTGGLNPEYISKPRRVKCSLDQYL